MSRRPRRTGRWRRVAERAAVPALHRQPAHRAAADPRAQRAGQRGRDRLGGGRGLAHRPVPAGARRRLPFAGTVLSARVPPAARTARAGVAGTASGVAAAGLIGGFPRVRDGGVVRETIEWVPARGLDLAIRIDGFAWMVAVTISVI